MTNSKNRINNDSIMGAAILINKAIKSIQPNQKFLKDAEPLVAKSIDDFKGKLSANGMQALLKLYPQLAPQINAQQQAANSVQDQYNGRPRYIPPPGDTYNPTYTTEPARTREDTLQGYVEALNLPTPKTVSGAQRVIIQQAKEAEAEKFKEMDKEGKNV